MEFTNQFFTGNRKKLIEITGSPLVVVSANGLLQRSSDTTFPFRQESNFWYLSGVEEADYILVFNAEMSFLIAPTRGEHRDAWDGAISKKELIRISGVDEVLEHHEGWTKLDLLLKKLKKAHTITPAEAYFESFGFYANPSRGALLTALKKHRSLELVDIRKPLARLRQIKQPPEIAALQKAIDTTAAALTAVKKKLDKYQHEYEIAADITAYFLKNNIRSHAYEPVIASGANAATIHYMKPGARVQKNALLLLDVGAEVSNYSADISRTYAVGTVSPRAKKVYEAVLRVQKKAYALLKPGVIPREYEGKVDALMAIELHKLGLLEDITDKKKFRKLYPHLTSHFLGLDTHDSADYDMPLEPGMVVTVEPGIYIQSEGIGVRIEDDVLITDNGIRVLSANLPSTLY